MPYTRINGIDTYYMVHGQGERDFFVFNGAGCMVETWDYLMPGLTGLGRFVRFDARGLGRTGATNGPYNLKTLAEDGLGLMDHLHLARPIVLAHAFGGRVAQVFTRDHPGRVRALILCGTGGLYPPLPPMPGEAPAAGTESLESRVERGLARFYGSQFRERHPERAAVIISALKSQLANPRPAVPGALDPLFQMEPAESYWGMIAESIPTLLIYGTEDRFGHEKNARDLAGRIKRARLVFIEGAGHMAIQEEPEQVAAAITDFVKEQGL
jgi:pimeloyl-ACP methyl ester carboxylesterase